MILIKKSYPWDHYTIQEFLSEDDFYMVDAFSKSLCGIHPVTHGLAFDVLYDAMKHLSDTIGFDYNQCNFKVEFMNIEPDWSYNKIHTDAPWKAMTFVLGLSPEGTGTKLYTTNDYSSYVHTTQWNQNGGTAFCRADNTWHDYDSIGLHNTRRTVLLLWASDED